MSKTRIKRLATQLSNKSHFDMLTIIDKRDHEITKLQSRIAEAERIIKEFVSMHDKYAPDEKHPDRVLSLYWLKMSEAREKL